jgi:hypothetical protein
MTFFVGHTGVVRLQRKSENSVDGLVHADDVNTTLNRFSFEGADDDLITGDFIDFSTEDERGLLFLPATFWSIPGQDVDGYDPVVWASGSSVSIPDYDDDEISTTSALPPDGYDEFRLSDYAIQQTARAYVNVNAVGGIRLYPSFSDAINNERSAEYSLSQFFGEPIAINVTVSDTKFNTLASVTSYELNTDRNALDVTSLSDNFQQQYSSGLLSGGGSVECLFSYENVDIEETPLFLLQVINRISIGSAFKAVFAIASNELLSGFQQEVFYEVEAVITRTGVTVSADSLISCSIDFVTNGEIKLRVGLPPEFILKEDSDAIYLESTLDYLLKEVTD